MSDVSGTCSWLERPTEGVGLLEINGDEYRIRIDRNPETGEITAISVGEHRVTPGERWRCSCPDWTYRGQYREKGCKHTAALKAALKKLELECHSPS